MEHTLLLSPESKLKYLSLYMNERIEAFPYTGKGFRRWLIVRIEEDRKMKSFLSKKKCAYCGEELDKHRNRTKDHIIPKCKGGPDLSINKVECCVRCNQWKGGRTLEEWKAILSECLLHPLLVEPYYSKRLNRMIINIELLTKYSLTI